MAKKVTKRKKKEASWDEIGKMIGTKMEKEFKKKDSNCKTWKFEKTSCGGFGRFAFIITLLYTLNLLGYLEGVPLWLLIILVITFSSMKF